MTSRRVPFLVATLGLATLFPTAPAAGESPAPSIATVQIVRGHPWQPPFGLDRVGRPPDALVTHAEKGQPRGKFLLVSYRQGNEVSRQELTWIVQRPPAPPAPVMARVTLEDGISEVALLHAAAGEYVELSRQAMTYTPPPFEAEAVAQPDKVINPVDLGAILPPADWLLLAGGQKATVEVAALARAADAPGARAVAWYESAPQQKASASLPLKKHVKTRVGLALAPCSASQEKDVLHVSITGTEGKELWRKAIRVMIVPKPPTWPRFGAVSTKLRYDPPILSVVNGKYTFIDYDKGWDPALVDVVAAFPNGARWVFWRGTGYLPVWAGRYNNCVNYECAERFPVRTDKLNFCDPLSDKELRYGRVEVVESTTARIHLRWTYRTCSFTYQLTGDFVTEDFYFYPDSFGTRVMTLTRVPGTQYELEEFIVLSPQAAYPLDFQPGVDILSLDGKRMAVQFPPLKRFAGASVPAQRVQPEEWAAMGQGPVLYRIRPHRLETLTAISFSPQQTFRPVHHFQPFYDLGVMVSPAYWGSHWPLTRGLDTGWSISDRVALAPASNSLLGWDRQEPRSVSRAVVATKDAVGTTRNMDVGTYVWLVGLTGADDESLVRWAKSFSQPPNLELAGAKPETELYAPERRALRLIVESPVVTILLKSTSHCVNPVFELSSAPRTLKSVSVDRNPLDPARYAWDGKTLWLEATLSAPAELKLEFIEGGR